MEKKYFIIILLAMNSLILILGCLFVAYSIYFKISFKILNTNIPGAIIGLAVSYFSMRYYKMLFNLKDEINKPGNSFSWSNFKREKKEGV